ncbi:hypothetical protein K457DRAFT_127727 [Linnemannia elongata AG-77]|uniref:Uncharacterized protein n=1 Tax=Linnemannia elongata AG-77 TaxID=1314771 RepID=A0A197JRV0_9FUNG|nr:hypothetical protein K457DRAFT_127727 [Linnemannia elongata AG-77]
MAEGELPGLTSWDEVDRTANPVREAYYLSKSLRNLLRRMLNLLSNKRCKRKHDETNKGLDNDDSDHEGKKVCFAGLTAEHQRRSLGTCEDLFEEAFEEVFEEVFDEKNKVATKAPTWTSQEEPTEMKVVQQEEPAAIDVADPKTEEVPFFKSGSSQ